jgi:hypothetical protein
MATNNFFGSSPIVEMDLLGQLRNSTTGEYANNFVINTDGAVVLLTQQLLH